MVVFCRLRHRCTSFLYSNESKWLYFITDCFWDKLATYHLYMRECVWERFYIVNSDCDPLTCSILCSNVRWLFFFCFCYFSSRLSYIHHPYKFNSIRRCLLVLQANSTSQHCCFNYFACYMTPRENLINVIHLAI